MKPIRTFIQQNGIRLVLGAEKPIYSLTKGKLAQNRFLSSVNFSKVGTSVKILKETDNSTYIAKYNEDGTIDNSDFKILLTTDIHLDEDYSKNDKSLDLLYRQIKDNKPDLVIFTGDCILSKYQQIDAIQFAEMMEEIGVYWAYVFGNHEAREEKEYFKYLIFKSITDYPHCLSKFGNPDLFGFGNFIINIMNSETELKQSLFFFDSGRDVVEHHALNDNVPLEYVNSYDYIKRSQIRWYENELKALRSTYGEVKNSLYMHIPVQEYKQAFKLDENGDYLRDENGELLRAEDKQLLRNENAKILYGRMFETVGCSKHNSGLFESMKKNNAVAVFSGHDHVNDFAMELDGILLVYVQYGSYNAYNLGNYDGIVSLPESEWQQGVTISTIKNDGSIELKQILNNIYL
jgi:predicted phosphodiesterase